MSDTPTFEEVFTQALQAQTDQLRTCMPAKVITVNATTVDVQPTVWPTAEAQPILSNVPIQWVRGGGAYFVFPLAVGNTGALHVTEACMDEWRRTGQSGAAIDLRKHHIGSAFFVPGLSTVADDFTMPVAYAALVGAPELRLGSPAATQAAMHETFQDVLQPALTALAAWGSVAHANWAAAAAAWAAPGGPGATIATLINGIVFSNYISPDVKVSS